MFLICYGIITLLQLHNVMNGKGSKTLQLQLTDNFQKEQNPGLSLPRLIMHTKWSDNRIGMILPFFDLSLSHSKKLMIDNLTKNYKIGNDNLIETINSDSKKIILH